MSSITKSSPKELALNVDNCIVIDVVAATKE